MRPSLMIAVGAVFLTGCSTAVDRQQSAIMNQIEQKVKLPPEAFKLDNYARYYAVDGKNIVGTYITLIDTTNPYYDLPIGQRRWISDHRNLPGISDGGCSVVNLLYDKTTGEIEQAFCNGVA